MKLRVTDALVTLLDPKMTARDQIILTKTITLNKTETEGFQHNKAP